MFPVSTASPGGVNWGDGHSERWSACLRTGLIRMNRTTPEPAQKSIACNQALQQSTISICEQALPDHRFLCGIVVFDIRGGEEALGQIGDQRERSGAGCGKVADFAAH